jgi:hypothetical protein
VSDSQNFDSRTLPIIHSGEPDIELLLPPPLNLIAVHSHHGHHPPFQAKQMQPNPGISGEARTGLTVVPCTKKICVLECLMQILQGAPMVIIAQLVLKLNFTMVHVRQGDIT